MCCNDIFLDVLFKRLDGDRRLSHYLRLYQLIVRSVFTVSCPWRGAPLGSPRCWPRGATNTVQIHWKSHVSFPVSWGRWPSLIRRKRNFHKEYRQENYWENHSETAQIAASGFLTLSSRNRPNSRLRLLSASFYVAEWPCRRCQRCTRMTNTTKTPLDQNSSCNTIQFVSRKLTWMHLFSHACTMRFPAVTYSRVPGSRNHGFWPSQRVSKHTLMKSATQPASVVSINH